MSALRRSSRSASGHRPTTGCRHSPGTRAGQRHAGAHLAPCLMQALDQIVGQERTVARHAQQPFDAVVLLPPANPGRRECRPAARRNPARCRRRQSSPVSAKRVGSPLALMIMPVDCAGQCRQHAGRECVTPPISMRALSPPPMRRARPPASTRPKVAVDGKITHRQPPPCAGAWRFLPRPCRGPDRTRCGLRRRARRSACRARGRSA